MSAKSAAAAADARQVWSSAPREAQAATRSLLAQASAGASADSAAEAMREIQSAERELRQIAQATPCLQRLERRLGRCCVTEGTPELDERQVLLTLTLTPNPNAGAR